MKRPSLLLTIIGLIYAPVSATAADSYLCTSELATGFVFDNIMKRWIAKEFRARDKFVVRPSDDSEVVLEVKMIGQRAVIARCRTGFDASGLLNCQGVEHFKMNRNTLRFMTIYERGYWDYSGDSPRPEAADTPMIQIGNCRLL